ncbi:hypothetical protein A7D02_07320 [Aeromonas salmonicida]|uniref:Putative phage protein n=1 Tax=Aeromonas salmonicida subsp. salmonicida TaxID=29491 RepID=A0A1B2LQG1_AERSS|nr:DUF3850 domain-containing protein [Aeromonas salmonicida]AOA33816.1 putative phage protein [Aeromonas salmonicida subsp. salmonicida]ORJ13416.1 hypothetical protein A7D02_07320 [Aeromonas salmonicida]
MKHELKIKPEYFAAVFFGEKTFEIRNNADRNFQVGDTLLLKAWDGEFNGDFVEKVVSYITDFEQKPGYVVLGLVNHREHELLEKFHRTGVAIERAISTGSVLADHPLKSRLELLANHHEREMELAAQLSDATRQCGVMAALLREVTQVIPAIGVAIDDLPVVDAFLERVEMVLDGKLPGRQDTEWTDAANSPVSADYRELQGQHDQLQSKHKSALDLLQEAHEVMRRIIPPLPQDCANRSDLLDRIEVALAGKLHICQSVSPLLDRIGLLTFLLRELRDGVEGEWCFPGNLDERIDAALAGTLPEPAMPEGWKLVPVEPTQEMVAVGCEDEGSRITDGAEFARALYADMLAAAPKPAPTKGRTITEGQEFELTTVLQAIASGFSDDPSHDAAALLKRITSEVPWTGDSFQIPPRQGGELCVSASPSSSPD